MVTKFRLWCENKKEWERNNWVVTRNGALFDIDQKVFMKRETHVLEQFTGKTDKNSIEVYVGDVVRLAGSCTSEVFFRDGSYAVHGLNYFSKENVICFLYDYQSDEIEVIGDIHKK